jgi:hypothetical protein
MTHTKEDIRQPETTNDVRQGARKKGMPTVLGVSIALSLVGMIVVLGFSAIN